AFPTTQPPSLNDDVLIEQWHIPRLDMHVFSLGIGIPRNPPWPDSARFNSTIDFDAIMPDHIVDDDGSPRGNVTVNCQASFKNGALPEVSIECTGGPEDEVVWFSMTPYTDLGGNRRPELSFVLDMVRFDMKDRQSPSYFSGGVPITANNAANEPSSYLTCLEGPPYDGLRCRIKSYMSVQNELVI
ncbi:hypothetical protein BKA66DRAFT_383564, partial [Pyrenochaeta sp. MPI-SDFR-AT-0127]